MNIANNFSEFLLLVTLPVKSCEESPCHIHFYLCGKTQNKNVNTRSQAVVTSEVCCCNKNLHQPGDLNLINLVFLKWFLKVR